VVREFSEWETTGSAASATQSQRSNAGSPCGGPGDTMREAG